jgi:hypothetical protein
MLAAMSYRPTKSLVPAWTRGMLFAFSALALVACGSVASKPPADGGGTGGDIGAAGSTGSAGGSTGSAGGSTGTAGAGGSGVDGGGVDGGPSIIFRQRIETVVAGPATGAIRATRQRIGYDVTPTCNGSLCFAGGIAP